MRPKSMLIIMYIESPWPWRCEYQTFKLNSSTVGRPQLTYDGFIMLIELKFHTLLAADLCSLEIMQKLWH
jgi:hypothetical protein